MTNIEKALDFGIKLIGTPYGYWKGGACETSAPMFSNQEPLPKKEDITSLNCAGLVNLMLKSIGKEIPYNNDNIGGTSAYYDYYNTKLLNFHINNFYPKGTLLIRRYRNINDQGHLSIILEDKGKNSLVLQSHVEGEFLKSNSPGVNSNYTLKESHHEDYYEYIVLPEDWLQ